MTVTSSKQSWFATEADSNHARTGPENDILLLVTRNASFGFYLLAFFQDKFTPPGAYLPVIWGPMKGFLSAQISWNLLGHVWPGGWASEIRITSFFNGGWCIPLYPTILLGFQPSCWCRISLAHPQYPTLNCLWWSMVSPSYSHIFTSSDWWFGTFLFSIIIIWYYMG